MSHRTGSDTFVLSASAAQTAANTGTTPVGDMGGYAAIVFELDLTAAATEAGDTLDVFVQTSAPDRTNWLDVVHFTQAVGNGNAKRYVAKIVASAAETMYETGSALAAGSVRNILGDSYRVRWTINDATTTGNLSFTFSVTATGVAA